MCVCMCAFKYNFTHGEWHFSKSDKKHENCLAYRAREAVMNFK